MNGLVSAGRIEAGETRLEARPVEGLSSEFNQPGDRLRQAQAAITTTAAGRAEHRPAAEIV